MVNYEKIFEPYYEGGWEAYPLETTLITAGALNDYDAAIMHIEDYLDTQVDPNDNLAETYDDTATYEVGDYCVYNGVLYKCITAIDEAEDFDLEKWDHVLVTDEMGSGGGGGTTVIANPVGTPTDDLETIQIGNTIYDIPGGGGGNANIWTGTQAELEEVFDELEEGTQINITDDEQEVVEGGTIYSEEEQVIGLWVDNKPLYQKTFVLSNPLTISANSWGTVDTLTEQINVIGAQGVLVDVSGEHVYYIVGGNCDTSNALTVLNYRNVAIQLNRITITYTKPTDAPLDAVVGKKTMYIASSDCYSTEEKEIGCFTDGKPMYQKTLYFDGTIPRNTWTDHNISDVDKIWVFDAFGKRSTDYRYNGINYVSNTDYTAVFVNKTQVYISYATDNTMTNGYITVRYTKTTDTAGSGSYTPASGKAVYYSTSEQVIGKWSNGKPLYRKCVEIASFTTTDQLIANTIYYGHFLLSDYISNVEMAVLDLNHSYLGTPSTFTRTILNAQYEVDTGYFTLFTIYSRQNVPLTLVIEYTKTTD